MSVEIKAPQLGESIVEATVGHWRKREGEAVAAGEPLVELETDKVNVEVTSPSAGVLASIVQPEGATVGVNDILALVSEERQAERPAPAASNGASPAPASVGTRAAAQHEVAESGRVSPLARRIASERRVDLRAVNGTGPGGQIMKEDVEAYLSGHGAAAPAPVAPPPPPTPAPSAGLPPVRRLGVPAVTEPGREEERVRMSRRRQTIAKRLVEAQHTAAMLTTFNEIDMSAVMEIRKRRRDAFKERHGVNLGFMSFFTRAVVGALKAFPRLNAEIQGDEMVLKRYYDIGIAVGVEEGLVVPVLRNAERLAFAEIERQIATFAEKARKNQLSLEDIRGGTFTITNGGVFGSLLSTPILNGPQVGILGMHKIQERPIALNGEVVIRPMMYVALSYDHRIVDGNEAVRFLVRVKELLEDPEALLLEG